MKAEYEIFKTNSDNVITEINKMVGVDIIDKRNKDDDFIKIKVDCIMGKDCYKILRTIEQHNQTEIRNEFKRIVNNYNRKFWKFVFITIIIISLIFLIFG